MPKWKARGEEVYGADGLQAFVICPVNESKKKAVAAAKVIAAWQNGCMWPDPIPTSERLPEPGQLVLFACSKAGKWVQPIYRGGSDEWVKQVYSHWLPMPMPLPPEEKR